MALFKVEGPYYKCEWCGKLFENNRNYHDSECEYDPAMRTCKSCAYSTKLVRQKAANIFGPELVYCTQISELFPYPGKHCREYRKEPDYKSFKKTGNHNDDTVYY